MIRNGSVVASYQKAKSRKQFFFAFGFCVLVSLIDFLNAALDSTRIFIRGKWCDFFIFELRTVKCFFFYVSRLLQWFS